MTDPAVFAILAADLRFFRRRPDRAHRLRLAGRCEVEEARAKVGLVPPPSGARAYCALKRIGPGWVHRAIGFAIDTGEIDFDEPTAAVAYALLAPQDVTTPPDCRSLWSARSLSPIAGGCADHG